MEGIAESSALGKLTADRFAGPGVILRENLSHVIVNDELLLVEVPKRHGRGWC